MNIYICSQITFFFISNQTFFFISKYFIVMFFSLIYKNAILNEVADFQRLTNRKKSLKLHNLNPEVKLQSLSNN